MLEVKGAAEDGTEFELTESEVNAARRNRRRDAYRIIFVRHVLDPARTLPAPAYPKPLLSTRSRHVRCTAFCADAATVLELSKLKSYRR
jgi:Protein NO VEIN, C-terminal